MDGARIATKLESAALDTASSVCLASSVPRGGFGVHRGLELSVQLATALGELHLANRVHGALSPHSVVLDRTGTRATLVEPRPAADALLAYAAPEQTGRWDRRSDHRSDLYSLGVILFEIFAGRPPFTSTDPLELVHAHLAKIPPALSDVVEEVPRPIAAIVAKLLSKSPDERYQSARGLLFDLTYCARALRSEEGLQSFELGRFDQRERLPTPNKLYGRDRELAALGRAFDRVSRGSSEVLLVAGPPGVGKSALVAEMRRSAIELGGFYVAGKFEQLAGKAPYHAIKQAFRELVRQVLAGSEERVREYTAAIAEATGALGQILIDLIPELAQLIGPQPPIEALALADTQARFVRVLKRFAAVFARRGQPLILFLDDWQWADPATLALLPSLASTPDEAPMLLIGAYRDSEVGASHATMQTIERIRSGGTAVEVLTLEPLAHSTLAALLSDTFAWSTADALAVARGVHARTAGNPFHIKSFLASLHDRRQLTFVPGAGWKCDFQGLEGSRDAENVISVIAERIERLPARTASILTSAACLGSKISVRDLAIAEGLPEATVIADLEPAISAGLLIEDSSILRFAHDRVQEGAYSQLSPGARLEHELAVGRRLFAASSAGGEPERLVMALEHLNAARALLTSDDERIAVARANVRAGRLARASTAYAAAATYARLALELAASIDRAWSIEYDLMREAHALLAEGAYLSGDFATAEGVYPIALAHARSDLDRIQVLTIQKDQYELQGRYLDAIATLQRGLELVGIRFPDNEDDLRALLEDELRQIRRNLGGRSIASLIDAPEITDPMLIATLGLLMGMWPSCYVSGRQTLLGVVSSKIANFSLVHGNCEAAPAAFLNYSFVAGSVTGDYATAFAFGELGLALADRYSNRSVRSWACFLFGCGTSIWRTPLRDSNAVLERAFELGVESGYVAAAGYAASYIVTDRFFQGASLREVDELYGRFSDFLKRSNPAIHMFLELGARSSRRLLGRDSFDETSFLAAFGDNDFFTAVYHFGRLTAAYLLDDDARAVEAAARALERVPRLLTGTYKVPEASFYAALAYLRAYDGLAPAEKAEALRVARSQHEYLARLSDECAENFLHKALLVEGELARVEGDTLRALRLYERGLEAARSAGFQQHQALAHELASRVAGSAGLSVVAAFHLREAVEGYRRWGATEKVRALQDSRGAPESEDRGTAGAELDVRAVAGLPLDLISVTKASQAISSEIELDALLAKLIRIIVENAGAMRGALALRDQDSIKVFAHAEEGGERIGVAAIELDRAKNIVESIVRYTLRTGETVVLADAGAEGLFAHDPEVRSRRVRSVLSVPIRIKDRTIGVAYLENDLSAGAFTPSRAKVIELLAGQAAISIENARLYAELLASVAKTEEAKGQAEAASRAKDEFLAMLGHELRNPLAPIRTACELMRMRSPEIFARERASIERQSEHMVRLVDDLLDVARIVRGKIDLRVEPAPLGEIIRRAVDLVTPLFEQRGTHLDADISDGELMIEGDSTRLAQVISNLLSNASKFSPPGSRVSVSAQARDGVAISVRDTGVGIAPDLMPRIFQAFVQGGQPLDRSRGGLGLGLAIAKSLVELHGGTIEVRSSGVGHGTEVAVHLPEHRVHRGLSTSSPEDGVKPNDAVQVLVVDDNVDAAEMLADLLRSMGHDTTTAHDGPAALRTVSNRQIDVALLDIGLPVMDGFELARRIRAHEDPARRMRIVAVTGYGLPADREKAKEAGFDAYLVKPVDLSVLASVLDKR